MKTKYKILFLLFLSFFNVSAQEKNTSQPKKPAQISVDLVGFASPILNRNFFGFSMDAKYYIKEKWGTGFNFTATSKATNIDFGVGALEPDLTYFSFGWLNQYDIIQHDDVRVGLNLNNGLAIVNLRDQSETEIFYDEFGENEVPVSKARSFFYIVEPGVTASFRAFKKYSTPQIFLTTQVKYRKAFGNPEFATSNNFSNFFIGVGVSFTGFFED